MVKAMKAMKAMKVTTPPGSPKVMKVAPTSPKPSPMKKAAPPSSPMKVQPKKTYEQSQETINKGKLTTWLCYQLSDKNKNAQAKETAREIQEAYKKLTGQMANDFAKKFMDNKKDKNFAWVKTFSETYTSDKEERIKMNENYMTRLFFLLIDETLETQLKMLRHQLGLR